MGYKCPFCKKDFDRNQNCWVNHIIKDHSDRSFLDKLTDDIEKKRNLIKKRLCMGTGHGSCDGETMCNPENVCFRSVE